MHNERNNKSNITDLSEFETLQQLNQSLQLQFKQPKFKRLSLTRVYIFKNIN